MPVLTPDTYTPASRQPVGGGNLLQFYMDADEHTAWLAYTGQTGTGAAKWLRPFRDLTGGSLAYDRDTEEWRNEVNELIAETTTRDEFVISRGVAAADSVVVKTIEFLEDNPLKAREVMPELPDGTYAVDDVDGHKHGTVFGYYEVKARKTNRSIPLQAGQPRGIEFELVAVRPTGHTGRIFEMESNVDLEDETEAPWTTSLADFTTTQA